ncbi:protein of unknown function (plasmid) [Azospirillum baldaniorum]|uniref:Uncharacterized protein n=1 Tax=Azospirillum baldaniorum TaxID=1064539 RepID=A0A9P1JY42_9PROT|nr:protein of unknown function [Azospirillum baldaniorum]
MARLHAVTGRSVTPLSAGWELCVTEPGGTPAGDWLPAPVPGTVAQALRAAGLYRLGEPLPLHDRDVWYRVTLTGDGPCTLRFHGLATVAEVWLDGKAHPGQRQHVPAPRRARHAARDARAAHRLPRPEPGAEGAEGAGPLAGPAGQAGGAARGEDHAAGAHARMVPARAGGRPLAPGGTDHGGRSAARPLGGPARHAGGAGRPPVPDAGGGLERVRSPAGLA